MRPASFLAYSISAPKAQAASTPRGLVEHSTYLMREAILSTCTGLEVSSVNIRGKPMSVKRVYLEQGDAANHVCLLIVLIWCVYIVADRWFVQF